MNPTFDMTCEYCNQLWNSKHHCVASDLAARIRIVEAKLKLAEEALEAVSEWAKKTDDGWFQISPRIHGEVQTALAELRKN
jgi:hypothetical protein